MGEPETLEVVRVRKNGSVIGVNRWRTGAQSLVFANMADFEKAKALAERGEAIPVGGNPVPVEKGD